MPSNTSVLIEKVLAANGIVLGKTRMHELAYGVTTINPYYGPVLNPYDNTCHVGGESVSESGYSSILSVMTSCLHAALVQRSAGLYAFFFFWISIEMAHSCLHI